MSSGYVLINCETGNEDSIIRSLRLIPGIKSAFGTFGSYDIIAKIVEKDKNSLLDTIAKKIRKIQNIRATLTLLTDDKLHHFAKSISEEIDEVLKQHMAQAYVIIHCNKSLEPTIFETLGSIPEIIERGVLLGQYDIILKLVAPSYNDITDIITKRIKKISGIKATITLNVIEEQGRL